MVKKEDFDFISEDEIEKAMRNIIGDKGKEYDHSKAKKKKYDEEIEKKKIEEEPEVKQKHQNKSKKYLSNDRYLDIRAEFEKEARIIVTDPELSTEEKIDILNKKLKKRYIRLFDKVKKLNEEELKIKDDVINSFIISERDILLLENADIRRSEVIYKDVVQYTNEISYIFDESYRLEDKDLVLVRNFANQILREISPSQNEALKLLSLTDYIEEDFSYLASHSINTAIMSMITALEMSKILQDRLETKGSRLSMNEAQDYARKIFNEEELTNLGIAGLLHDISLKIYIGNTKRGKKYPPVDKIKFQRHPYESYYEILNLKHSLPTNVLAAIENHHENIEETGFPKQINKRFLDKYQRIVSFVSKYEEMAHGSPFHKHYGPSLALNYLMRKERTAWDSDVMLSFLKATSLYPVGSYLELNSGDIGIVHSVNKEQIKRPIIKVLIDSENNIVRDEKFIDLSEHSNINIKQIIHPHHVKEMFKNYENHFGLEQDFLKNKKMK